MVVYFRSVIVAWLLVLSASFKGNVFVYFQVSVWVLGFIAFLGNGFVILWRIKTERAKVSSFFIINLGCSDLLMGVYLLVIASVDVHYRGRYIQVNMVSSGTGIYM